MRATIFILLINMSWILPAAAEHPWGAMRGTQEGAASFFYDTTKIQKNFTSVLTHEWHHTPSTDRKYHSGMTVWTSPALAAVQNRPMAFIGGYDQTMHALDIGYNRVIWTKITNGIITNAPVVGIVNGEEIVFWGSSDRTIYAHKALTGERLWTKELVPPSSTLDMAFLSSPFLTSDRVYITCFAFDKSLPRNRQQGQLVALDIATGTIIYRQDVAPGFLNSPVGFTVNDRQYIAVAAKRGQLKCFDVTGERPFLVWHFQMPHEVLASPVILADSQAPILFLGSKYGNLIAIDATNGKELWQYMTGNWIDNTGCIGEINGEKVVFIGSHDYRLYAFAAKTGALKWKMELGGEVYSAPSFFTIEDKSYVAVATLDSHLNLLDAKTGRVINSYFTGNPLWEKITKGENLWGSPAVFVAGEDTAIVHGSFNGSIYVIPVVKPAKISAMTYTPSSLWKSLTVVIFLFCGVILPLVLYLPDHMFENRRN